MSEIDQVYNRLQEAHKIISELTGLLQEARDSDPDLNSEDYLDELSDRIADAIHKYKHITGE